MKEKLNSGNRKYKQKDMMKRGSGLYRYGKRCTREFHEWTSLLKSQRSRKYKKKNLKSNRCGVVSKSEITN